MSPKDAWRHASLWVHVFVTARQWNVLVVSVLVLSASWMYVSRIPTLSAGAAVLPSPQIGFLAPDFTLDTAEGGTITLSELRGQVVLINLWASWCPPCRAEMPAIDAVYRQYRDAGLVVLAVNTTSQDREATARAFAQNLGLTFPILFDRDGAMSRRYQLRLLPTSFFVGPDGIIRDIVLGGVMNEALIATRVERLLAREYP